MTRTTLIGLGLSFTLLLVGLPMAHVYKLQWTEPAPGPLSLVLALFPVVVLFVSVHLRATVWRLFTFPVSHLPVLIAEPRLIGPLIYGGVNGLLAQTLVLVVAVLWIRACLMEASNVGEGVDRDGIDEPYAWLLRLLSALPLAVFGAFAIAVLDPSAQPDPGPANLALLVGWVVSMSAGARWMGGDLQRLILDPEQRRRSLADVLVVRRFSSTIFWTAVGVMMAMGTLVTLVYGLKP